MRRHLRVDLTKFKSFCTLKHVGILGTLLWRRTENSPWLKVRKVGAHLVPAAFL